MAQIAPQLIGESPLFLSLLDWVSDLASLAHPVLIMGERGTGKELLASRLHFLSPRWEQGYFSVNCAAFDDAAFEEIMYEGRGGMPVLEKADGGTLYIDNVDMLPRTAQERLARVIEYGEFDAGDGRGVQTVDIRFVASLSGQISQGALYETISADFLDRLALDVVHIPPIRIRKEDIAPLTSHFGRKACGRLGATSFPGLSPEADEAMLAYDWPGNARELKNVVERGVMRAFLKYGALDAPITDLEFTPLKSPWPVSESAIKSMESGKPKGSETVQEPHVEVPAEQVGHQSSESGMAPKPQTTHFVDRIMKFERGLIDEAMTICDGHQGRAAQYLNLTYHQFRGLLRKHGLKK